VRLVGVDRAGRAAVVSRRIGPLTGGFVQMTGLAISCPNMREGALA
jgi:hypothetical protein